MHKYSSRLRIILWTETERMEFISGQWQESLEEGTVAPCFHYSVERRSRPRDWHLHGESLEPGGIPCGISNKLIFPRSRSMFRREITFGCKPSLRRIKLTDFWKNFLQEYSYPFNSAGFSSKSHCLRITHWRHSGFGPCRHTDHAKSADDAHPFWIFGDILHQTVFDFPDILTRGKSCSIWNPEDVSIHRYHGMSKSGIEDDIRRLSSDSRKSLNSSRVCGISPWCFSTSSLQVFSMFLPYLEPAQSTNETQNLFVPGITHGLRIGKAWKEKGHLVDRNIRSLCAENRRDQ